MMRMLIDEYYDGVIARFFLLLPSAAPRGVF
ncbi:hypothetical protein SAMN04488539_0401 [Corynebacterium timonense]|uniref:Uncharacterized protein n=1 Tax=Corynebacterium timonense TaxID=441500 RepID=A0A1H1M1Q8_9CORY|nr:hypothetical protein SAMN04488539_0401 [Corynebacterium timonense]